MSRCPFASSKHPIKPSLILPYLSRFSLPQEQTCGVLHSTRFLFDPYFFFYYSITRREGVVGFHCASNEHLLSVRVARAQKPATPSLHHHLSLDHRMPIDEVQ